MKDLQQRFKGVTLRGDQIVENILDVYYNDQVDSETGWYQNANELAVELANRYDSCPLKVAGIIASLSPLKSWDENKRIAESFLRNGESYHTGIFQSKAEAILEGDSCRERILEILNGNKIQNFFLNIAFPKLVNAVTIDRHAVSIAHGYTVEDSKLKGITDKQYNFFKACYVEAARIAGVLPNEMQAVTWVKWRKLKAQDYFADVPF